MVKITWWASYAGGITVTAKGHADGSPEFCAMISALLGAWSFVCDERNGTVREESGDYYAHCKDGVESYAALRAILGGLRRVQEIGPEFICIENTHI